MCELYYLSFVSYNDITITKDRAVLLIFCVMIGTHRAAMIIFYVDAISLHKIHTVLQLFE